MAAPPLIDENRRAPGGFHWLALFWLLMPVIIFPAAANAADDDKWPPHVPAAEGGGELSVGAGVSVDVTPYKNYETGVSFLPVIEYENDIFYFRDFTAGLKLFTPEPLEFSVFLAYDAHSFDPSDTTDPALRHLNKRRESILVGGRADWLSSAGLFRLSLAGDVSGHSHGFSGQLGYFMSIDLGTIEFTPQAGVYWNSQKYNTYYYGLSAAESRRSDLPAYEAEAAFTPYLGLAVDVVLDNEEHWEFFGAGEVSFLPSQVKNSPMVDRSNAYNLTTGVTYTF
ncbi:MAG: MipA/OmpV family protein [Candidatus Adiutrix sp.]|jgi:outer membrane protein|nr:MipA/OmpV family protein [Candidatus Adiutrix sp.]